MSRWVIDVVRSVRRLFREQPALLVICVLLLVRLLLHQDDFVTIRDLDFLPVELRPHFQWTYRGGRPLTLFLNQLWLNLLGWDLLLVKRVGGAIGALLLVPLTLLLGDRAGLGTRGRGVLLALVLGSASLFASYDSLGPYFLLTLCVAAQFISLVDALEERVSLVPLGMFSMIGLMVHRNALVTTAAAGLVLLCVRRRTLLRNAGDLMVMLGTFAFGVYRVLASMPFDRAAAQRQLAIYANPAFMGSDAGFETLEALRKIFSVLPDLLVAESGPWLLALFLMVATLAIVVVARRHITPGLWWAIVVGLVLAMILAIIQEAVAVDFFFRPNHGTYTVYWVVPVYVLAASVMDRLSKPALHAILVMVVGTNLLFGYSFRREALDAHRYQAVLQDPRWNDPPVVQFPAFVASIYGVKHWRSASDGSVEMEKAENDYRVKGISERFVVDVFEYHELGEPMYRYREYEERLLEWARELGYLVRTERHATFVRFILLKSRNNGDARQLFVDPRW